MGFHERWEAVNDDFLKFERVENKRCNRPDLHAFLVLNELQPGTSDLISAAEHDEYFLDIDCDKLAEVITDEQILELTRCGIRHSDEYDCLAVFA